MYRARVQEYRHGQHAPDRDVPLPGAPVGDTGVREAVHKAGHGLADNATGHGCADAPVNPGPEPDVIWLRPREVQPVGIAELARVAIPRAQEVKDEGVLFDDLTGYDPMPFSLF
jgi:hypothetical protein